MVASLALMQTLTTTIILVNQVVEDASDISKLVWHFVGALVDQSWTKMSESETEL